MYPFSEDLEYNSRDTPGCKGLDLGALSKRFSYGTGGGSGLVVVEINVTSRQNPAE